VSDVAFIFNHQNTKICFPNVLWLHWIIKERQAGMVSRSGRCVDKAWTSRVRTHSVAGASCQSYTRRRVWSPRGLSHWHHKGLSYTWRVLLDWTPGWFVADDIWNDVFGDATTTRGILKAMPFFFQLSWTPLQPWATPQTTMKGETYNKIYDYDWT